MPVMSGLPSRPCKKNVLDSKQQPICNFLISTIAPGTSKPSSVINDDNSMMNPLLLLCWRYWDENITVNNEVVNVKPLLLDLKAGNGWYAEPHIKGKVRYAMQECMIEGCFRRKMCLRVSSTEQPFSNLTCNLCKSITKCDDFQMRLYREQQANSKRGERGTGGHGRRLGFLTQKEIQKELTCCKTTLQETSRKLWWATCKISTLSVRVRSLHEASIESLHRKDVRRFCNNVLEAHRLGKFGGKVALWDFMQDVAQNIMQEGQGHRYKETSKAIFEMVKMWGGPRLNDLSSENLCGPSISTTKRQERKAIKFLPRVIEYIFQDVANIYIVEKQKHGISSKVPFIIVEDEIVVKCNIRWNASDDTLLGFCGPRSENHQCISSCMIKVGDEKTGYENIVSSFQNYEVGHYGRVLIANPLHCKLPRLALVVHSTCNRFDASFVKKQWDEVDTLWNLHLAKSIGPIVGHASNGGARRRKLMLDDYLERTGVRYNVPWSGWMLSACVRNNHVCGLHDQDFIHNGKKLVNAMDNASRELVLGDVWVTLNRVSLVFSMFPFDVHGAGESDLARDDRQNWASSKNCRLKSATMLE